MKKFFFLMIFVLATVHLGNAQQRFGFQGVYEHKLPRLTQVPPLNTGMPLNVLLGYIYIDSFARRVNEDSLLVFLKTLGYSDTSKKALSYLYQMDDYDPVRYFQYSVTEPSLGYYKTLPIFFFHNFGRHLSATYPDSGHSAALYYADYILDVRVLDTISRIDTISAFSKSVIGVSSIVLDTIKGNVLPPDDHLDTRTSSKDHSPLSATPYIRFDYRPSRIRVSRGNNYFSKDSTTVFPDGTSWIKPNQEYIVFLLFNDLHDGDSANNYASLEPEYAYSTCASMYPVVNGVVYDPNDDFGFGTGLSPQAFKDALRHRISTLSH